MALKLFGCNSKPSFHIWNLEHINMEIWYPSLLTGTRLQLKLTFAFTLETEKYIFFLTRLLHATQWKNLMLEEFSHTRLNQKLILLVSS